MPHFDNSIVHQDYVHLSFKVAHIVSTGVTSFFSRGTK